MELAFAKPMKKTQKFALAPTTVPVSGYGGAGVSSSRAPTAHERKASTSDTAHHISLISMLAESSSLESQV
jgi:hypothetical protein